MISCWVEYEAGSWQIGLPVAWGKDIIIFVTQRYASAVYAVIMCVYVCRAYVCLSVCHRHNGLIENSWRKAQIWLWRSKIWLLRLATFFSLLGTLADRAIYFACDNFFFLHGNQFCVIADLFTRSRSISGSAGPIFTIFAPYSRYWIADDQSDLLFFDTLRDVVTATNLVAKIGQNYLSPCTYRSVISKWNGI